jgi:hypothetical protein
MAPSDLFAALDARIAAARADLDAAQADLARHEPDASRLFAAIREHRDLAAVMDPNAPDDVYAARLARSRELQLEIEGLQRSVDVVAYRQAQLAVERADIVLKPLLAEREDATWLSVPSACAALFEQAERCRIDFERALARIDSVASFAHTVAHQRPNGAPENHPAHRVWMRLREMIGVLSAGLGANADRDFRTGPALVRAIEDGAAEFGDVSRFEPRSQALPDGSAHFNRAAD